MSDLHRIFRQVSGTAGGMEEPNLRASVSQTLVPIACNVSTENTMKLDIIFIPAYSTYSYNY